MKIFILEYVHKHGNDISAFTSREKAESAAQDIANEFWADWFDEPCPSDPKEACERYFNKTDELESEWYYIYEITLDQ